MSTLYLVGTVKGITDLTLLPGEIWLSVELSNGETVDACLEEEVGIPVQPLKLLRQLVVVSRVKAGNDEYDYSVIPSPIAVDRSCVCCA